VVQDDDSTADAASSPAAAPAPAPPRPAGSTGWCGSSSEVCLLAWISSQDGGSGEGAAEDSGSGLHRLRDALDQGFRSVQSVAVDQLNEEFRKCVARSSDISYREVRGLEDRLLELNRLADDALQLAAGQAESARGFRANQERWLSLRGDPSLLADLCASHRSQLEAMAKQHDALRDKRLRILRSKEEFTINLHRRLKWLSKIQLDYSHNKYRVNLMKTQVQRSLRAHELLQQAERSPYLYARALAEIVRRRSFAKKYNEWTRSLSSDSSKLHDRERTVRKELAHTLRSHLLRSLFTSLAYRSLSFATKPPEDLDTGLPRVTRSDLEALAVRVPELRPHLILRENVPAEEVFRKFRRLAEVAAASRQLPRRHSVGLGGPPDFVDYPDVDSADATRALADADSSTGVIRPRSCGSVEFLIGPCSLRTGAQHQQHPQPPPIHESHSAVDFASTSPGVGARGGYSRPISFPASRLLCGLGESRRSRVLSVDTFDSGSQNFLCEEDFADPLLLVQPRTTAEDASQPVDIPVRRRVRTITEGSSASLSSLPVTLNISPGGEDFYTCPDFSKAAAPAGQLVPGSSSSATDATGEFGRWTADLNSWLAGAEASVRREQEAKLAELKDEVSTVTRELHEYADQLSVANADYDRAVADHQDQLQRQQDQAAAELDALNRRLLVEHELEQENMRSELTSRLRDLEEENNRQRYYLEEAQRKLEAAVNERNKATNNDQVWRDRLERAKAESGQLVEKLKYSNRLETENALQDQRLRHEQELEELRRENQELSGALAELRSASPTPAETKDAKIRELEQRLADLNRQMLRDHELMRRLHQRASGSGGDSQSPLSTSPVVPSRLAQQSAAAASAAVTTSGHADLQLHGQQLSQQLQQSTSVAVTSVYVSTEPSEQSSASAAHSLSGAPDRNVCLCHCGFRKGDSVLLYYSHAHEQWTLYCSDGGLYFVKDSTLGTLGLPAHLPVGHSQPIMLAEFQSKEHCQTRK
uniref:ATG11 domain-containing protein n=1 Tax=Macrostomum lignano TaxID=282301 RepID=A0A1I8G5W9_9PLAT